MDRHYLVDTAKSHLVGVASKNKGNLLAFNNQVLLQMKYSLEITIQQPREKVVALFDSSDNLKEWMPNLQSFQHLSGEPGQPGAKSKMVFLNHKRRMEMIETIIENTLPEKFAGTYEASGTLNIQENSFAVVGQHTTKWISHAEFRFSNLGMKLLGFLMPGAFKKQSMSFMKNFKEFAEKAHQ